MGKRKSHRSLHIFLISLLLFGIVFVGSFFGVQYFTKTGIFHIPGVVYYDESLSETELATLKTIFSEDVDLDKDVMISAKNSLEMPELSEGEFLTEIAVPVTDFYSSEASVSAETPEDLFLNSSVNLIPIKNLDFKQKLLSINDNYYLDKFTSGAIFRVLKFESENYDEEIKPLVETTFSKTFPEKSSVLTFAETGVTAFSRGMNAKLLEVGDGSYFARNIKDFLSNFDLTHTSNEASFYSNPPNGSGTTVICAYPGFIDALTAIGLDIVELTGNHNRDCGDTAANETIDVYNEKGIKIVGGGKTADEARIPLELSEKGTSITMLGFNLSTGGVTLDDTPGANQYYEDVAASQISAAKEKGDLVIVNIQYYECSAYASTYEDPTCDYANSAAGDQVGLFRHLIDLGADIVVGTSAHQPQTFELYGDGVIYYGLGNLFFDQVYWPGTTRSLILGHYFYNGKLLQTKITPTVYDKSYQTRLLDEGTTKWFIKRLVSERP